MSAAIWVRYTVRRQRHVTTLMRRRRDGCGNRARSRLASPMTPCQTRAPDDRVRSPPLIIMSIWDRRLRMGRAPLLLLVFLALASPLHAERLILKSYTTADGLPHDAIHCVVEDARGFLWFCTDDGLSRFDGYGFTNYGIGDGLPGARVNAILPAPDGRHWIATSAGLIRFDPHGPSPAGRAEPGRSAADRDSRTAPAAMFSAVVPGLEGRARYVTALLRDRAGIVWVGTHDGLYRMTVGQGDDRSTSRPWISASPIDTIAERSFASWKTGAARSGLARCRACIAGRRMAEWSRSRPRRARTS